ncbi:MAG: ATP-binding protein, partial [Bradyrhizobium sp.]|nr:ATP-binding protein [Bradyrhizobium sp.]
IPEVIGSALARASKILASHRVQVEVSPDLPMLQIDAVLFEQVLFNLLDNAATYAAAASTILIEAWQEKQNLRLQIIDEGTGIPEADVERIFDKFYRATKADSVRAGTGLGLAISRGFVEAMGGTITASNRGDHQQGAVFTITMPLPEQAQHLDTAA